MATTSRIRNESPRRILSPPPPRLDPADQDQPGDDDDREPEDLTLALGRQRDAPVLRILRPDRDQVLLLREPVDGVEEEVLVSLDAEEPVADEVGVAEDGHPRLR